MRYPVSNDPHASILEYIWIGASRSIRAFMKDLGFERISGRVVQKKAGYVELHVSAKYMGEGDFLFSADLRDVGDSTKLYLTAHGDGISVAPRPERLRNLERAKDSIKRKAMVDVIGSWVSTYDKRYLVAKKRANMRKRITRRTRRARGPQLEVGDRVKVLSGPLKGVKVTVREIDGRDALVSATMHGRKTRVPLRDLQKLPGTQPRAAMVSQLIRLGSEKPELRDHLSRILDTITAGSKISNEKVREFWETKVDDRYIEKELRRHWDAFVEYGGYPTHREGWLTLFDFDEKVKMPEGWSVRLDYERTDGIVLSAEDQHAVEHYIVFIDIFSLVRYEGSETRYDDVFDAMQEVFGNEVDEMLQDFAYEGPVYFHRKYANHPDITVVKNDL